MAETCTRFFRLHTYLPVIVRNNTSRQNPMYQIFFSNIIASSKWFDIIRGPERLPDNDQKTGSWKLSVPRLNNALRAHTHTHIYTQMRSLFAHSLLQCSIPGVRSGLFATCQMLSAVIPEWDEQSGSAIRKRDHKIEFNFRGFHFQLFNTLRFQKC